MNDLILSAQNLHLGNANVNKRFEHGIISPAYKVYEIADCNPDFIQAWVKQESTKKFFLDVTTEGASQCRKNIDWNMLANSTIPVPSEREQSVLGSFITVLDNAITLHQCKYNQNYIDGFTTKIRSDPLCFTATWEQRKIQDIYRITRGYVLAAPETDEISSDDMPYPVYSSQTKNNGLMGYYKDYLYENAITWTTDGANAGTVNYRAGKFYCTNVCGVLLSDEGYSNKCAAEALNRVAWKWVSHIGNPKLMNNVMGEISISLPLDIEEQSQISVLFDQMDNLITLHQC